METWALKPVNNKYKETEMPKHKHLMYVKFNTEEKNPDFEHDITAFMRVNGYTPSTEQHRSYQTRPGWKGVMTHMIFTLIEDKEG